MDENEIRADERRRLAAYFHSTEPNCPWREDPLNPGCGHVGCETAAKILSHAD